MTNNSWNSANPAEVAKGGTGVASTTAFVVVCGGTTSTAPLQPLAGIGSSGELLTSNGAGALPTFQAAAGGGVTTQQIRASTSSLFDLSTAIPFDDSIPQNDEGNEILTVTITPTATDSILVIQCFISGDIDSAGKDVTGAIFRDDTAGALAASQLGTAGSEQGASALGSFQTWVTSGATDATTFKLRVGTWTTFGASVNGVTTSRRYGGVSSTTMTVTEFTA